MTSPNPTRKRTTLSVLGLIATVGFTGLAGTAPAHAATEDIVKTDEYQKNVWRQQLLTQVNDYRKANGLAPFKYSETITGIAQDEADDNVRNESLAHSGNFGRDTRAGNRLNGSEISAWYSQVNTAKLVDTWKSSPGHNATLLDPSLKVVGFGVQQTDGELKNTQAPWALSAVMDGFNYHPGREPRDTRTTVPGPFKDVSLNHVFAKEMNDVKTKKILNGWSDGTFKPNSNIGRYAMAAVAYRIAGEPAYTPPAKSHFKDVKPGDAFYKEINWTKDAGIFNGWSDGTFRPGEPIGRYATAAMFYRLAGSPEYTPPAEPRFKDVPKNHGFYKEISWLADEGITTGWSDGTFRSGNSTIRANMSAFISRYMD